MAGTTVATLSTVDADAGDSHTYAITSDPSGFFEIVGNEVRVASGANIDFETDQTHDITVEVTDAGGNTYSEVITLTVNDLFDEDPTDITLTGGSVDENAAAGTTVATLSTTDADAGDSHTYAITSDPSGFFEVVGNEVRVASGANIDFETDQTHDITVEVTDAGGNTYSEVITLTVNDLFDEDPTDITLTGGSVDENAAAGTTVATLNSVDADAGDSHTYAITSDPSGYFEIVGNEVRVASGATIDFETDQTHDITVEVTDAGGNTYSEVITLTVNDLFDEDPTDITLTGGSVDENAAAGTTVATLSATDADAGDSHTYAITSDPAGFFEIVGNEVRVASGANIDFETDQTHDITVEVTDAGGNTYAEVITLTVNDLFDEDPTDITLTGGNVDENAAPGTTVATLSTVDADAGDSHTYAITSDPSGFFEIVGNEVRVASGAAIDFETDQSHDITVEVTDVGGNTYSEVITLTVNGLFDEDPTDITLTGGSVDENAAAGTTVATLSTVDADAGDSHTYAITSDPSGFFEIVGNEVRVASGAAIDFETDQSHDITVEVTDVGGNTYSEVITLTVNDLFDEDPTDITLTGGAVDENAAAGTTVATLSTVDADAGDSHSYAITSDPSGYFEIVGNEVRVASGATIDFETDQTHDITVEVTDAGGNTYSEVITLTVNDLFDEDPTDITLTGGSVDENAAAGTTVATLSTVDADAGDSHTYAITSDPSGFFEIVGNEVRVASGAAIDFETDQTHDITVEVTDAGGNTYSEVVTVNVNDLFDEDPIDITVTADLAMGPDLIINGSFELPDVSSNSLNNYSSIPGWTASSGFVQIHDNFGGHTASDGSQYLDIDAEVGIDHVYQDVETENGQTYQLDFAAADRSGHGTNAFQVYWNGNLVADVDPASTAWEDFSFEVTGTGGIDRLEFREVGSGDDAFGALIDAVSLQAVYDPADAPHVIENSVPGTVVATLGASDPDAGDSHTYAITNDPSGFFEIVGNEIRVAAGASIDFEAAQSHDITVEVTDAGGNTHSEVITIEVDNLFDTSLTAVDDAFTLDEDAAFTGNVLANDIDSDAVNTLSAVGGTIVTAQGGLVTLTSDGEFTYTPPANYSGGDSFTYSITDGGGNTDTATVNLTIDGVADAPNLSVAPSSGFEGNWIPINISASLTDTDGSETLAVELLFMPNGTKVTDGVNTVTINNNEPSVDVAGWDMGSLSLRPPPGQTEDFDFRVVATSTENGQTSTTEGVVDVEVNPQDGTTIVSETYNDPMIGTSGSDTITGDNGEEIIVAGGGDDVIDTGSNQDRVDAGSGDDTIIGGNQEDFVIGGTGADEFTGGGGDDFFVAQEGAGNDTFHGGSGTDTMILRAADGSPIDPSTVDIKLTSGTSTLNGDQFDLSSDAAGTLTLADGTTISFDGVETISWADNFSWDGGNNTAAFADGAGSTLTSGGSEDVLVGGAGDDTLTAGSNEDLLTGGAGADTMYGGADDDVLVGGEGADTMDGGTGDDVLFGDGGDDIIDGGADSDTAVWSGTRSEYIITDNGDGTFTVQDTVDGRNGTDTVQNVEFFKFDDGTYSDTNVVAAGGNNAPTAVDDTGSVAQNDSVVIDVLANDTDADGDTLQITGASLTSGEGSVSIVNGKVVYDGAGANTSLAYGETATAEIVYTVSDGVGGTDTATVTVTITGGGDGPNDIQVAGGTIAETAATGTVAATLSATDPTSGETFTYEIVDAGGNPISDANFEIVGNEVRVKAGSDLDYESDTVHNLEIKVTDSSGQSYQETIAIDVTDVNEAPTDIVLDVDSGISLNADGGNNAYLYASDSGDIVGGLTAMTVEVGFSTDHAPGTDMSLFSYHAGGASDEIELGINDYGSGVGLYIEIGEQAHAINGYDATQLLDGAVHQVSLTWDNTAGGWEVFVDGASVASGTGLSAGHTIASGGMIVLGQEQDSLGGGFDNTQMFEGTYTDVRIFDDVRTDIEISDNINTQLTASEPGLVANWQMEDLSGGTTTDIVSGTDLTVGHVTGTGWVTSTPSLDYVSANVDENAASGSVVATLSATDDDPGDTHTFAITNDPSGFFEIVGNEVRVAAGAGIDFESDASHDITVEVTDSAGNTYSEVVTVTVNDVNEAPTDIVMSGADFGGSLALNTDGTTDDYASISGFSDMPTSEITVEVRFTSDNISSDGASFFSYAVSGSENEFSLFADAVSNELEFDLNGTTYGTGISSSELFDGTEHTVSMSWDSATGAVNIYVDGVSEYSGTASTGISISSGGTLIIGQEQDSLGGGFQTNQLFSGTIDEVRIFSDVRTAQEIADNYGSEFADPASEQGLVSNWQFNGENGGVVTDVAGNNDLTLNNGAAVVGNTTVDVGTTVATAAGIDDAGDTLSYALTDDAGGLFSINSTTGEISVAQATQPDTEFTLQTSFADNPFSGIDAGSYSTPTFADIDGDGDLDAFIGESGGIVVHYENTGDATNPNYVATAKSPFGLTDVGSYADPTFVDIDNDGDLDAFVGGGDGYVRFFQNTGTSTNASFTEAKVALADVGTDATPAFVDIDGDGDLDAFVGNGNGDLTYYENTGTASSPTFTLSGTNPFGLSDVGSYVNIDFADIDGDGDMDAFVGEDDGTLNYFENTGTIDQPDISRQVFPTRSIISDQGEFFRSDLRRYRWRR